MQSEALSRMRRAAPASVATVSFARNLSESDNRVKKGVRHTPTVPDRLRDAISYFGNRAVNVAEQEADAPYIPQDKRSGMMKEVLGMHQNLKNASKLDRLKTALDAAGPATANSDKWKEAYLFMRTTEQCNELVREEGDEQPRGSSLWIDLTECEEARRPHLCRLPNGMLVLPCFSFEEYLNHYFQRLKVFESVWFPVPRMGSKFDDFCAMEFPVLATGTLASMAGLATVAIPNVQVGLLVNAGQASSKFITFPEMVRLSKKETLSASEISGFPAALQRTFNTTKMPLERITFDEAAKIFAARPAGGVAVPLVAQLELQLLLFPFPTVERVFVRLVQTPAWKRMMGKGKAMTQLDIILKEKDSAVARLVAERVSEWSFLEEFDSDVHMEFAASDPPSAEGAQLLYDGTRDGDLLRKSATPQGESLRSALGYDDPV